ncbi:MAG: xanthine dehydrogenase FAD-binding subunit XdhB [Gemmatimonadales bacterium]|nr:xanthine dehydrogenase FAD-binding subunit XdhB [Gemmatimonadales bacterium]
MFPIEEYHQASNVADAIQALSKDATARILAGGTDVLVRLHGGNSDYGRVVDINDLDELREIRMDEKGNITIGALACCSDIIENELVQKHLPMVAESLATIGGPQVRNCATMGGNICNGAVSADSACAALVYEFDLVVEGVGGQRIESINGFHTGPGRTILKQGDILTSFLVRPENYTGFSACYRKYAMRGAMDIATIGCGVALQMAGEKITTMKLAFTVAAPTPIRCRNAEQVMVGEVFSEENLEIMADELEKDVAPRTSWRASKEFRLHIIKTLAKKEIRRAVKSQGVAQ